MEQTQNHDLSQQQVPLAIQLLKNLGKLETKDRSAEEPEGSWHPDEIHNVDRLSGLITKKILVQTLKSLEEHGFVESEKVLYSAWLKWHLAPAAKQLVL